MIENYDRLDWLVVFIQNIQCVVNYLRPSNILDSHFAVLVIKAGTAGFLWPLTEEFTRVKVNFALIAEVRLNRTQKLTL